jgi:hypothetical protein
MLQINRAGNANDAQINVVVRMFTVKLNEIIDKVNTMMSDKPLAEFTETNRCSYPPALTHLEPSDIQKTFGEYAMFVKRPDYTELYEKWFSGVSLADFPPVPAVPVKEEEAAAPSETPTSGVPEGAQIFGGDYASKED